MKSFFAHWATRVAGFFLLLSLCLSHAQPGSSGPHAAAPTATPIDASLLLAGGIARTLKKLRRRPY